MADMNQLTQLIVDVSSDDFFFTINIHPVERMVWFYVFVRDKAVDSSFFDLSDIEKAMTWIEEQREKHGRE